MKLIPIVLIISAFVFELFALIHSTKANQFKENLFLWLAVGSLTLAMVITRAWSI